MNPVLYPVEYFGGPKDGQIIHMPPIDQATFVVMKKHRYVVTLDVEKQKWFAKYLGIQKD